MSDRGRVRHGWRKAKMELLHKMMAANATIPEMAAALDKSETSVVAKLAHMKHGDRARAAVLAGISGPAPRKNDDAKHLAMIAQANGGFDFPVLDLPARYRVAA